MCQFYAQHMVFSFLFKYINSQQRAARISEIVIEIFNDVIFCLYSGVIPMVRHDSPSVRYSDVIFKKTKIIISFMHFFNISANKTVIFVYFYRLTADASRNE